MVAVSAMIVMPVPVTVPVMIVVPAAVISAIVVVSAIIVVGMPVIVGVTVNDSRTNRSYTDSCSKSLLLRGTSCQQQDGSKGTCEAQLSDSSLHDHFSSCKLYLFNHSE
jgi:hypothetical protein